MFRSTRKLQLLAGSCVGLLASNANAQEVDPTHVDHVEKHMTGFVENVTNCLLYTSPSPRDRQKSRMPSSA